MELLRGKKESLETRLWSCSPPHFCVCALNTHTDKICMAQLASVPGFPCSVCVLIMHRRQTFEKQGRPGLKYHVRVDALYKMIDAR